MNSSQAKPDPFDDSYFDTICLIDSIEREPPPSFLVEDYSLFIVQAASSNPVQKDWRKRRPGIREFVLNPPDDDEIIPAYGLFFLFFSADTD